MAHLIAMLVNSRCCLILCWEQLLLLEVVLWVLVFPALPPFAGAVPVGSCFTRPPSPLASARVCQLVHHVRTQLVHESSCGRGALSTAKQMNLGLGQNANLCVGPM